MVWRRPLLLDRRPRIVQHDQTDCGAACLCAIASIHGVHLPIARLRQLCNTTSEGTTLLGLMQGATAIGLEAKGVRAPWEALRDLPLPAIAHVVAGGLTHFVAIYRISKDDITLMDPRDGRIRRVGRESFEEEWTGVVLLLVPRSDLIPTGELESRSSRLWTLIRPHRSTMIQALTGAAVYTVLGLSTAIFVQKLVDNVLPGGNENLLNLMGIGMLVLILMQAAIGGMKDLFVLRTGQHIDGGLIMGYCRHVLHLPQSFFDRMKVGEVVSRVGDAVKIRAFVNDVALNLLVSCFVLLFSFSLMFAYSARLALAMAAVMPVYAVIYALTHRSYRTTQRAMMERAARLEAELVEALSSASTVKRFGIEGHVGERVEHRLVELLRATYQSATTAILSKATSETVSRIALVIGLWFGGTLVLRQALTAGELMSFYALIGYLTGPTLALIGASQTIQDASIATDRLFEVMDLEAESALDPPLHFVPSDGSIRFRQVTFSYGGHASVLRNLNFDAEEGSITALLGPSGSGKTTISGLCLRMYSPTDGRILVGGRDIREIGLYPLRRFITTVPQEIHLMAGSVIENLALGDTDPDLERLALLCDELGITEFVRHLPAGFGTLLGERGVGLSGGQRQRIAIARALYRQPRVLILDEATASLDPSSERQVMRAIRRRADEGLTVILITHRLSSGQHADRIHVLGDGNVIECGTHTELISREGAYRRLWEGRSVFGSVAV